MGEREDVCQILADNSLKTKGANMTRLLIVALGLVVTAKL